MKRWRHSFITLYGLIWSEYQKLMETANQKLDNVRFCERADDKLEGDLQLDW